MTTNDKYGRIVQMDANRQVIAKLKNYIYANFSSYTKSVMNTCFKKGSDMTINEAIKRHKGFKEVRWHNYKDNEGKVYVVLTARVSDVNRFFLPTLTKYKNKTDSESAITRTLFELIKYKKHMTLFYNYEDIFSYLHKSRELKGLSKPLEFDHTKSNVMIYIKFLRVEKRQFISVSSGYSAKLKTSNPDMGYFGGLFDDLDLGNKCIDRIYSGNLITLESSF